jgi:hypothetical protein
MNLREPVGTEIVAEQIPNRGLQLKYGLIRLRLIQDSINSARNVGFANSHEDQPLDC